MKQTLFRSLLSTMAVLLATTVWAYQPTLNEEEVQAALAEGVALGEQVAGYPVADWIIWRAENTLLLEEPEGLDAVVIHTPFERLRWVGYVQTQQDKPVDDALVHRFRERYEQSIEITIYAHSLEQTFLQDFGAAEFVIDDYGSLEPTETERVGPSLAEFLVAGESDAQTGWSGQVNYHFDLAPLAEQGLDITELSGTFTFTDFQGNEVSHRLELANFR